MVVILKVDSTTIHGSNPIRDEDYERVLVTTSFLLKATRNMILAVIIWLKRETGETTKTMRSSLMALVVSTSWSKLMFTDQVCNCMWLKI